jgi:5-formyltetrahydrofolate cyclo-ligase
MNKSILRSQMISERKRLSSEFIAAAGAAVRDRLINFEPFAKAHMIMTYIDAKNELPTRSIIAECFSRGIRVCVPKVLYKTGQRLIRAYEIRDISKDLRQGSFGILEPFFIDDVEQIKREIIMSDMDIILVPGVAFDVNGNRIGYGAGYYDRFFKEVNKNSKCLKIGLCFDYQLIDQIDADTHDVPVDCVFTEKRALNGQFIK